MKRRTYIFGLISVVYIVLFATVTIFCTKLQSNMNLTIYLGESHEGTTNIAQLFYAEKEEKLLKKVNQNPSLTDVFDKDNISFDVSEIDFDKELVRFDPFNRKQEFSVEKVTFSYGEYTVFTLSGKEFLTYVSKKKNLEIQENGERILCMSKNQNPAFIMNQEFSATIQKYVCMATVVPYIVLAVIYLLIGMLEWYFLKQQQKIHSRFGYVGIAVTTLSVGLGVIAVYAYTYFAEHFGQVPFGQLVYHLHTPLDGTDISSYENVIILGVVLTIGAMVGYLFVRWLLTRNRTNITISLWFGCLGVMAMCYGGIKACYHFDIPEYYAYTHASTSLYEDYYVDGREVDITFSEQKRNLIYIFLESMEVTYADAVSGGSMADNYIPELTKLGLENETFSDGMSLNGAHQISGATYTMGGLAAQTCGVPINENMVSNDTLNGTWESENNYLPGVWSIGDILHDAGYNQEFLIGSNGNFAGRASYFRGHGEYDVEDYNKALEDGRIPKDYKVWWGYEDQKLFQFAKEDVTKLADKRDPFNMTLLTVDTHFTDGYVCDLCEENFNAQYSNVLACSSRQVAEFVEWVQQQDFYENTTIVIAGDHLTPDSYYIANEGASGFDRRTYVTIINPADGKHSEKVNRTYTTLDLFPTTLSAMGVEIEGDRLGLGVDLYSGKQTLVEEMGLDALNTELLKNSDYYTKKLLYEKR